MLEKMFGAMSGSAPRGMMGSLIGSKMSGSGNRMGMPNMGMGQGVGLPVQGQAPMMQQPSAQPPQAMPGGPSPELLMKLLPLLMQNSSMMGGMFANKQQPPGMNSSILGRMSGRI